MDFFKEITYFTSLNFCEQSDTDFNSEKLFKDIPSHSGEIVCCVIDNYPVGIDVENIAPIDLDIASNFFLIKNVLTYSFYHIMNKSIIFINYGHKRKLYQSGRKRFIYTAKQFSFKINSNLTHFEGDNRHKCDFTLYNIDTDNQSYQLGICAHKGRLPDKIIEIPYMDL